ncbi:MAG: 5-(carboxyamino)imidazole ribonucleotide mutase [Kiritimatiellae bacterium]|nr:5-(carboxyamino)imidazole ribonucleotide mutase [Kiritimatiellia bacterium]
MAASSSPLVAIVMGSDSDWPSVHKTVDIFKEFAIPFEVRVISAHRSPALAASYAAEAEARGLRVIVAAAGGAAHLGGVLAAHTVLPVIGIPMPGGALNGLDALLATVQMPAGVPVGTVTLGSAGPVNAALLAVQILGASDDALRGRLHVYRQHLQSKVADADAKIAAELRHEG